MTAKTPAGSADLTQKPDHKLIMHWLRAWALHHLYTLTSTRPVAIATNSNKNGRKIAARPMIARGSCKHQ